MYKELNSYYVDDIEPNAFMQQEWMPCSKDLTLTRYLLVKQTLRITAFKRPGDTEA